MPHPLSLQILVAETENICTTTMVDRYARCWNLEDNSLQINVALHFVGLVIGCDISSQLVQICRIKGFDAQVGDALNAPYRSNSFDGSISIAVLHHLSTKARRLAALRELIRVLRPGGRGLVYAWAFEQGEMDGDKGARKFPAQDVFVPFHFRLQSHHPQQMDGVQAASFVKDKNSLVFQRYCHVYKRGELQSLLMEAAETMKSENVENGSIEGNQRTSSTSIVRVEETYYDMSNWCVRFLKVNPAS
mmetsp:Transcript_1501/g.2243  ORF Transcript_1501/g.2243 Transcript_1501/m.2243 type:complete len:247 (-) Transcript_1501:195-935(-)